MSDHKIPAAIIKGRVYHKPKGRPYAHGATLEAVKYAGRKGYDGIDIDYRTNSEGTGYWCHWANPTKGDAWFNPKRLIGDGHPILKLTDEQCGRLTYKSPSGETFTMMDAARFLRACKAARLVPCVEDKTFTGHTAAHWAAFKRLADGIGIVPVVMSLPGTASRPGTLKLKAAHDAGLVTMWLYRRGSRIPSFVDLVKSHPGRGGIYRKSKRPIAAAPKPPEVPVSTAADVIKLAERHIGFREGRNNTNPFAPKMGWANNQAWCASFVCAQFKDAGLLGLIKTPSAGVDQLSVGFKRAKRWSEYPAVGAVAFYGSPRDLNHTGIVKRYDKDFIYVIEGNTNDNGSREGNGVYLKKRARRGINVVGYGYPAYKEGIVSADPAWQKPPSGGVKPWTRDGIDLSHWNDGRIDWAKAKAAGIKFVYHKATEHTGFRDDMYASRRAECKANKVPFGAYHFARPGRSSGTAQAEFFLAVAKPKRTPVAKRVFIKALGLTPADRRPMLDLEDRGGLTDAQLTKWVGDWVRVVTKATGKPPIVYTPFDLQTSHRTWLWVARYSDKNAAPRVPRPWKDWIIHQFSNGENGVPDTVPGIPFPVDINTVKPGFNLNKLKI